MSQHSESWREGFDHGYSWYMEAKEMGPLEQVGGIRIPTKPYRAGDEEYKAGVADGIVKARAQS